MRDCEIDIVAPEKDVVADGDPLDRGIAALVPGELEQAEIRRAAPDVDHQNMARRALRTWQGAPRIAAAGLLLQPPVERRLRLLEQAHMIGEAGLLGGGERQPLRRRVERGWDGDRNVLGVELELGPLPCKPRVPCRAEMGENERRGGDGRDLVLLEPARPTPTAGRAPSGRRRDDRARTSRTSRRAPGFRWPCAAPACPRPNRRSPGHGAGSARRPLPPAGRGKMEPSRTPSPSTAYPTAGSQELPNPRRPRGEKTPTPSCWCRDRCRY